ncbi:hypothetical protein [Desulfovibrio gilichinskyi]|uniref:Uncharacterized protein n=1 Tax=Desulfovibrio gilichinskyi TaxID=1519643 RepID=A0A1X7F2V7_9BACT|nr:hypothetical protein [Desulfovibrio gilichinskyi]SMF44403.1 hypothetical protein SAMN06295933_3596 [Desulfovibrio gilichinskyi]
MTEQTEIKKLLNEQAHQIDKDLSENPGAAIEIDQELAEHMGAFEENSISLEEAEDASFDPFDAEKAPEPED